MRGRAAAVEGEEDVEGDEADEETSGCSGGMYGGGGARGSCAAERAALEVCAGDGDEARECECDACELPLRLRLPKSDRRKCSSTASSTSPSAAPLSTVRLLAERPSSAAIAASALLLWRETLRLPRPGPGGPTTSNSESPQPEPELLFSSDETPLERSASASTSPTDSAHVLGVRRFRVAEMLAFDGVRRQAPDARFCDEPLRDGCSEMGCESG